MKGRLLKYVHLNKTLEPINQYDPISQIVGVSQDPLTGSIGLISVKPAQLARSETNPIEVGVCYSELFQYKYNICI